MPDFPRPGATAAPARQAECASAPPILFRSHRQPASSQPAHSNIALPRGNPAPAPAGAPAYTVHQRSTRLRARPCARDTRPARPLPPPSALAAEKCKTAAPHPSAPRRRSLAQPPAVSATHRAPSASGGLSPAARSNSSLTLPATEAQSCDQRPPAHPLLSRAPPQHPPPPSPETAHRREMLSCSAQSNPTRPRNPCPPDRRPVRARKRQLPADNAAPIRHTPAPPPCDPAHTGPPHSTCVPTPSMPARTPPPSSVPAGSPQPGPLSPAPRVPHAASTCAHKNPPGQDLLQPYRQLFPPTSSNPSRRPQSPAPVHPPARAASKAPRCSGCC